MSWSAVFASFAYLCYGSTAIIKIVIVGIDFRREYPRAERIDKGKAMGRRWIVVGPLFLVPVRRWTDLDIQVRTVIRVQWNLLSWSALESQKASTASLKSKQLKHFDFAWQDCHAKPTCINSFAVSAYFFWSAMQSQKSRASSFCTRHSGGRGCLVHS